MNSSRGYGRRPPLAEAFLDRLTQLKCAYWEKALAFSAIKVSRREADDLGTQNSLLVSPMYCRILKPAQKIVSVIKGGASWKVLFPYLYSRLLIPDFIEAGFDVLNPVQVSAAGMDTKELKRDFGDCLTFWGGGVDTQNTLPYGTPAQVKDEVKRRIEDLAPSGGFVFGAVHNIQVDVPPENIEAMLSALSGYATVYQLRPPHVNALATRVPCQLRLLFGAKHRISQCTPG